MAGQFARRRVAGKEHRSFSPRPLAPYPARFSWVSVRALTRAIPRNGVSAFMAFDRGAWSTYTPATSDQVNIRLCGGL